MSTTISITSRWQIHIPKKIRESLGLKKPGKVAIRVEENKIIIAPVQSMILHLGGTLSKDYKKKKIDVESVRDVIDYSSA